MTRLPFISLAGALALSLFACQPQAPTEAPGTFPGATGDAIATINGDKVTSDMLDTVMRGLPQQVKAQIEAMGDTTPLVESIVASELLYHQAVSQTLHEKPLVRQDIAMAVRSAMAEAMVREIVSQRLTDERVQTWYDEHKVQFARGQVQLAHIMLPDMEKAESIKAQLDAGGDFAALAKEHSLDTMTSAKGGEIGWIELKQMAPPLKSEIETAEKGAVLGPLSMGRTIHVFRVIDRRDAQPLEEVRDQISAELEQDIRQEYVEELKEQAVIVETYKQPAPAAAPEGAQPTEPAAPEAAPAELEAGKAG